jgi:glucokinase
MDKILCGVDIGGTKLSTALVDTNGQIIDRSIVYDHAEKPEDLFVEQVALQIKTLFHKHNFQESDVVGIGMGCAGHLRFRDGVMITTSNLKGFKEYPLRDAVQAHFKIPVILDNDANAQAFGEFNFGAGVNFNSMIFLTISTGIGAGIILNHKLYRGLTGTAGEFGHTIVNPETDLLCTCGNKGCLMACACGMALPHLFRRKIEEGKPCILDIPENFDYSTVDGKFIKKGYDLGDLICREIILETGFYLGIGLYNIFQVFNPPLIVLGGGLLSWGEVYLNKIKETFYTYAGNMLYDPLDIVISEIGPDAGVIGAASLPLE